LLMTPRPPLSTLFPYTTLFRSQPVNFTRTQSFSNGRADPCPGARIFVAIPEACLCASAGGAATSAGAGEVTRSGDLVVSDSLLRSEEHTSELQSLTISYAVFCL